MSAAEALAADLRDRVATSLQAAAPMILGGRWCRPAKPEEYAFLGLAVAAEEVVMTCDDGDGGNEYFAVELTVTARRVTPKEGA